MSEHILVITTGEAGCYWYPVGRSRKTAKHLQCMQQPPDTHTRARTQNKEYFPPKKVKVPKLRDLGRREGTEENSIIQESAHLPPELQPRECTSRSVCYPRPPPRPQCTLGAGDLATAPKRGARDNHYLQQDPQPGPTLPQ